ncbi:hypothetical protein [Streptosporangium jomthongense]|uniref:Uncharacterized protein n=1 Tax=Streptosporangium jomthongense TaxID=1193683 RepID=A0ABV8ET40_9ACTN
MRDARAGPVPPAPRRTRKTALGAQEACGPYGPSTRITLLPGNRPRDAADTSTVTAAAARALCD